MGDMVVVVEDLNKKGLKWLKEHYQRSWRIFCLNKEDKTLLDFADHCEVVDLIPYSCDFTETSLRLFESELDLICPIAEKLSSILGLDVSTALYRYLLENHYIKKARIAKIKSLYNLSAFKTMYVDSIDITYDGFLNILPLSKYRPLIPLYRGLLRSLLSLKNILKSRKKAVELLLYLSPTEFYNSRELLDLLRASGVEFTIVDKMGENMVYGLPQDNSPISSKLYRYLPHILRGCSRSLSTQHCPFVSYFMSAALRYKYSTEDIYYQFRPKVILFGNEPNIYQSIGYHQLKKNGVVVLNFMHGEKLCLLRDALAEYDDFLVWGKYYADLFEKLRYRGRKITVVGNPGYDRINSYKVTNAELLGIRKSYKKILSVYTQPSYGLSSVEWHTQMMTDVCNYVRDRSDILVLVKHHPSEFKFSTADYGKIIGDLQNVKRCYGEYELYDLIAVSDLVLTLYSTVGLEAILFRKNVMYLNYGCVRGLIPYTLEGSAIELNDSTEFEYYVSGLLSGTIKLNQENTISIHANALDGQATQHMYDNIVKYL